MSILKKLFGAKAPPEPSVEVYNGFRIFPEPRRDGSDYRIAARIEKDVDRKTLSHSLIRADTIGDLADAEAASVAKAKQMIDQQGDALFR